MGQLTDAEIRGLMGHAWGALPLPCCGNIKCIIILVAVHIRHNSAAHKKNALKGGAQQGAIAIQIHGA